MLLLIVGTIPAVVIGLLFKDFFEDISKQESRSVGSFSDRILSLREINKRMVVKMDDITYKDALIIGSFQGCAIFPAISRSE